MEVIENLIVVAGENGGFILNPSSKEVSKIEPSTLGLQKIRFLKKEEGNSYLIADNIIFLKVTFDTTRKEFEINHKVDSN